MTEWAVVYDTEVDGPDRYVWARGICLHAGLAEIARIVESLGLTMEWEKVQPIKPNEFGRYELDD